MIDWEKHVLEPKQPSERTSKRWPFCRLHSKRYLCQATARCSPSTLAIFSLHSFHPSGEHNRIERSRHTINIFLIFFFSEMEKLLATSLSKQHYPKYRISFNVNTESSLTEKGDRIERVINNQGWLANAASEERTVIGYEERKNKQPRPQSQACHHYLHTLHRSRPGRKQKSLQGP